MRLLRHLPVVLLVALLAGTAESAAPERVSYALIIANNASLDPKLAHLRYADDDGARYHELLSPHMKETVFLSVLDEDTQSLYPGLASRTRPPNKASLQEALGRLNKQMREDRTRGLNPVLYFIFTGHGKRGPAGEGTISLLDGPFTRTDLFEKVIGPSTASLVHLIVDACDSYFFVNARGGLPVGPAQLSAVQGHLSTRDLSRYPHVGVVLSTSSEQESHEWSAIRSGVFSHQVRSALSGAADVNSDGRVEYSELQAFLAAASQRVADVRGRTSAYIQPPAQDRATSLVDLSGTGPVSYLMLPTGLEGRLWVEDARGLRLAEFHKERARTMVVKLPPGRGYFLRGMGREAAFELSQPGAVVDAGGLPWRESAIAARGAAEEAFRERLFAVPFGPDFYHGYMASLGLPPVVPEEGPDLSP